MRDKVQMRHKSSIAMRDLVRNVGTIQWNVQLTVRKAVAPPVGNQVLKLPLSEPYFNPVEPPFSFYLFHFFNFILYDFIDAI
jgi:hypothetical protein